MENFYHYNPVKIFFGKGEISKLSDLISKDEKVMLIYGGGSIKKNGIYDQVLNALKGYELVEFSGVEPNPHYETLMKAVELARNENVTYLLAVGGGSVIDGTKFISAAIPFKDEPWDIIEKGLGKDLTTAIPFGTVLTLPATGSEMNSGAVVTRVETQDKRAFGSPLTFAQFSILDPEVIYSLPKRQIANGIVDAFVHVLEQYVTYPVHAHIQDRLAEGILSTLIEVGPKVLKNPKDYDNAASFMWAATNALNGQLRIGVPTDWATHMIGHELTALYGIDHARTLAIIWPNLAMVEFDNKKEKLSQYGKRVWGLTGSDQEIAKQAIEKTKAFFQSLDIQTAISEYSKDTSQVVGFVKEKFSERGWKALGERQDIDSSKVEEILNLSL